MIANHRLKRAFYLAARAAVRHDPIAKTFHQRCTCRGLNYCEAVKRVARRMSDLVYVLLKSGKAYDRLIVENANKALAVPRWKPNRLVWPERPSRLY